jgi:hypothetical protein
VKGDINVVGTSQSDAVVLGSDEVSEMNKVSSESDML